MKGLLLKDWYMMKMYCKSYHFIAIVFVALSRKETASFSIAVKMPIFIAKSPVRCFLSGCKGTKFTQMHQLDYTILPQSGKLVN